MYSTSIKGFLLRLSNNYLPPGLYQVHLGYPSHQPNNTGLVPCHTAKLSNLARIIYIRSNLANAHMSPKLAPGNSMDIPNLGKVFSGVIKSETRKSTRNAWDYPNVGLFRQI